MKFSFLHVADIHFGRALGSIYLKSNSVVDKFKNATEKSFENLVNFAISNKVDFILIAGDTFDSIEHDFNCTKFFIEQLKRLESAKIYVYMICGNHDPLVSYKNFFKISNFSKSDYIKIFGLNLGVYDETIFSKDNLELAKIHALSFEEENYYQNPTLRFSKPTKNLFNIGLLHCDMSATETKYAPCAKSDLENLKYDYFALGHIHKVDEKSNIQYCGTIQGRKMDELNSHGAKYIEVEDLKIVKNEFISFDKVEYKKLSLDISDFDDVDEIKEAILANLDLACDKDYILFLEFIGINKISDIINQIQDIIEIPQIFISKVFDKTQKEIKIDKNNSEFYELFAKKATDDEYLNVLAKENFENTLSNLTKKFDVKYDEIIDEVRFSVQNEAKKICGEIF